LIAHEKFCAESIANLKDDVKASTKAHAAVKEAIAEVQKYQAAIATSLIQLASESTSRLQTFAKVLEEMKEMILRKNPESNAIVHELIVLCQAPANAGDKADRILKLLQELEARVAGNLATERNNLSDLEDDCARRSKEYNNRIEEIGKKIDELEIRIKGLEEDLRVLAGELKEHKANLEEFEKLHKEATVRRAKLAAYYTKAIKNSNKLVKIMQLIVKAYDSNVLDNTSYAKNAATTGNGF